MQWNIAVLPSSADRLCCIVYVAVYPLQNGHLRISIGISHSTRVTSEIESFNFFLMDCFSAIAAEKKACSFSRRRCFLCDFIRCFFRSSLVVRVAFFGRVPIFFYVFFLLWLTSFQEKYISFLCINHKTRTLHKKDVSTYLGNEYP